jgi:hypothetical protein
LWVINVKSNKYRDYNEKDLFALINMFSQL